jgi:hypothetical protein
MIFGAAERYRRATVFSSHHDAHPDNSTMHTGAVRPHTGFVESLIFISLRTGHGSSQVFDMLSAFSCISWACAFRAGDDDAFIIFSGPAREVSTGVLAVSTYAGPQKGLQGGVVRENLIDEFFVRDSCFGLNSSRGDFYFRF